MLCYSPGHQGPHGRPERRRRPPAVAAEPGLADPRGDGRLRALLPVVRVRDHGEAKGETTRSLGGVDVFLPPEIDMDTRPRAHGYHIPPDRRLRIARPIRAALRGRAARGRARHHHRRQRDDGDDAGQRLVLPGAASGRVPQTTTARRRGRARGRCLELRGGQVGHVYRRCNQRDAPVEAGAVGGEPVRIPRMSSVSGQ